MPDDELPPLTFDEFQDICSRVPRPTVDLVVRGAEGFLLTKRAIEPCAGQWHLPGGTVFFGELPADTITDQAVFLNGLLAASVL